MTVFLLIVDGVVIQKEPSPREGFTEAPDWVTNGCLSAYVVVADQWQYWA